MAELRIQPKKPAPSPWLLVGLAALLLAAAAYFYLRPDPTDDPAPAATTAPPAAPTPDSLAATAPATSPPNAGDSATASLASGPAASASPAGATLIQLSPELTQLADRADLREDALVREQRDNFTSATARLTEGDPQASLRPGLVAAANLLLAIQQKSSPALEDQANALVRQASQLSGRDATPAEQAQNRQYLGQVAALLGALREPAS